MLRLIIKVKNNDEVLKDELIEFGFSVNHDYEYFYKDYNESIISKECLEKFKYDLESIDGVYVDIVST